MKNIQNVVQMQGQIVASGQLLNKAQIKAGGGRLLQLKVSNFGPVQKIMLFDSLAEPTQDTSGLFAFELDAGGFAEINDMGFSLGLWAVNSSSPDAYTPGAADCMFYAETK